ncbi:MAG: N-acetyltransferase, partial [Lachnospiraceae bacterium]|nr:N-acetyltransferase [Lachnospiraceae bacterium]
SDTPSLLNVYPDQNPGHLFNIYNVHVYYFHTTTLERMQGAVDFWVEAYREKWFVRWAVVDKEMQKAIGTIELFTRQAGDYFNDCGLLRLDLQSGYENAEDIHEILSLIVPPAYDLFHCRMIATKVIPAAAQRREAVEKLGFTATAEALVGHDGTCYTDYYVRMRG